MPLESGLFIRPTQMAQTESSILAPVSKMEAIGDNAMVVSMLIQQAER